MNADARIAFLFPGQGSQRPGMLANLRDEPAGAAALEEAADILGRDPLEFDSAEAQAGTRATQLGLLIVGVASARLLAGHGLACDFVAGHSVGAFAAAVHAQALRFDDALRLVDRRGKLMAEAYPTGYGMAAISGLPERSLQAWIDEARERGAVLHLANRNAARQFTVSGADADLDAFVARARANGAGNALRLAVAVPSHTSLLDAVAAKMRAAFSGVQVANSRIPFATNRRARIETYGVAIAEDLALGVADPVRWHEINCALYERGVRVFVEMAPGSTLSRLAQGSFADVQAVALEKIAADALSRVLHGVRR